jgi:glucose-1-phosphate cytidylyltransferase
VGILRVVILAGGLGTRLSEETEIKPKPLVEIGGKPIIDHIMQIYSSQGFDDFIICLGYKGYLIKEYFAGRNVSCIDTGEDTQTGGRILNIQEYIDDTFMLTYGDGLANININSLLDFHLTHDKVATVTAVNPPARFGNLTINKYGQVNEFTEKPFGNEWINGGFFVLEPEVFNYIKGDEAWEQGPLNRLASSGQLMAYKHTGFWKCMDTLRNKMDLEDLWKNGAPWV